MTPGLERAAIEQFRDLVAHRFGLHFEDAKLDYLADVLRQRMDSTGSTHFGDYIEQLSGSAQWSEELRTLAQRLTVNETFFFRNADNFRAFIETVLPDRMRARGADRRLHVLSAGCASGEEPYTLAILLRESLPDLGAWDVKITGIDINPAMLARARRAEYSAWSLRATSKDLRRRYFQENGRDFVLDSAVARMVSFEERNLVGDDPLFWQSLGCDVIFCRNVLMYFTPDKAWEAVQRMTRALLPNGYLFLGHAETLRGLTHGYHLCHTHDTFYYRLRSAGEARSASYTWARTSASAELPGALAAVAEANASWVDIIQQASERIAALVEGRTHAVQPAAVDPGHSAPAAAATPASIAATPSHAWDLNPVLEAVSEERFSDALALISSLPADAHENPDALLLRAALLTNHGRLDESEQVCNRLLALDELNAGAHYLMALCREHAGDPAGASEHDQTAIYLDPGFAMPYLHRGLMAKRSGDLATARHELGQALTLLAREDASRLLLFGGGFSRSSLQQLCRTELRAAGGTE